METRLFEQFAPIIRTLSQAELSGAPSLLDKLRMAEGDGLQVCYAPFEYVNLEARVVIVGITPGRTQMLNSINEAHQQLNRGADLTSVLRAAKRVGAFSGSMRPNLVGLLDTIGVNRWLGIQSCDALFSDASQLVHTTSVLRNPVFVKGENYNGTPDMVRHPLLRTQLLQYFGRDAKALSRAVFIPLGDKVASALQFASDQGCLDGRRVLGGLPHPSGANAERIAYFMGRKSRESLSAKTNSIKLDVARETLTRKVLALE